MNMMNEFGNLWFNTSNSIINTFNINDRPTANTTSSWPCYRIWQTTDNTGMISNNSDVSISAEPSTCRPIWQLLDRKNFQAQETHSQHWPQNENPILDARSTSSNLDKPTVTCISSDKKLLRRFNTLLDILKQERYVLQSCVNGNEVDWQSGIMKIGKAKMELQEIRGKFEENYVSGLCQRVKNRRKFRACKRKSRKRLRHEKVDALVRRQEMHKAIDEVVGSKKKAREKQEVELQRDIDNTLSEIRQKKKEMSRLHDLFRVFRKLRGIRQEKYQVSRKGTPDDADQSFDEEVRKLEKFVKDRSVTYKEEEKTMQVMLEGELNEMLVKERERLLCRQAAETQERLKMYGEQLFGNDQGTDSLPIDYMFYNQAEANIESFLNIRRQWDTFVVDDHHPDGTGLPVNWIAPCEPSNETWAYAL